MVTLSLCVDLISLKIACDFVMNSVHYSKNSSSAPKGLFSKPRPYTYQVGSRHSPDTKNTKIYVLGAENCKIHQALKYLRQLISE